MICDTLVTTRDLEDLRQRGMLEPSDIHVADAVARLTGASDAEVLLAVALAVRAPRLGHVCLDLRRIFDEGLSSDDGEVVALPIGSIDGWMDALRHSPAVRNAKTNIAQNPTADGGPTAPLVLDGYRLYLDRYWRYEQRLVAGLHELLGRGVTELRMLSNPVDGGPAATSAVLDRLFGEDDVLQRQVAEHALTSGLTVMTGGPGTGKTTTIARLLATLELCTSDEAPLRIALTAPTGKAATRMASAVSAALDDLPIEAALVDRLRRIDAVTVHRLLGYLPGSPTRFRHDASHPLPFDVVVLDEASMASLPLMTKLVDALPATARLLMVGDRDQLASVEAGAVLSDVCEAPSRDPAAGRSPIASAVVRLTRYHRFGADSGIGVLARAIQGLPGGEATASPLTAAVEKVLQLVRGDTLTATEQPYADVRFVARTRQSDRDPLPRDVLDTVADEYTIVVGSALGGTDPAALLKSYERLRVLCALRRGPQGVERTDQLIATAIARREPGFDATRLVSIGRPLMVTRNDHQLGLFNGDVGVVVANPADPTTRRVAFPEADGGVRLLPPSRLPDFESVFAMSIHKSQGSQFDTAVVVLPDADVPLLTRELVYTAVTRASERVTLVAEEAVLRSALLRQVQRASGLSERLWQPGAAQVAD